MNRLSILLPTCLLFLSTFLACTNDPTFEDHELAHLAGLYTGTCETTGFDGTQNYQSSSQDTFELKLLEDLVTGLHVDGRLFQFLDDSSSTDYVLEPVDEDQPQIRINPAGSILNYSWASVVVGNSWEIIECDCIK